MNDKEPRELLAEAERLRGIAGEYEFRAVKEALTIVDGNICQAADILALPQTTLDRLLRLGRLKPLFPLASRVKGRPKK